MLKAVRNGQPVVSPSNSGPVAQLGARFHGMEEVVGSIPTRSTKSLSNLDVATVSLRIYLAQPEADVVYDIFNG